MCVKFLCNEFVHVKFYQRAYDTHYVLIYYMTYEFYSKSYVMGFFIVVWDHSVAY